MKLFKRAQKGFTLVELMVVMAIIAVLAAIVIPPVTGTKQVSSDTQIKQDASAISSAVGKFNADANLAQNVLANATAVLGTASSQETSNKWPERPITTAYGIDFPADTTLVSGVTIKDKDGTTTLYTGVSGNNTLLTFVSNYTAISFSDATSGLVAKGYLQQSPGGLTAKFSTAKAYDNYLFLLKKVDVETAVRAGRVVEVYSLTTVTTDTTTSKDALTYQRIY